ncbi:MAG TPA: spore germination protein GerW family protein [Ktedonobacteraceae bacterium]|jgi:uncharacterized spore protein YtfJ|nr:spore germination protein GerW family protein [Ktedonobacteraceae bacterium]
MSTNSSQETQPARSESGGNILKRLAGSITGSVRTRTIFGTPVEKDGITVIPVARARWATGSAGNAQKDANEDHNGEGITGDGGVNIIPAGYVEVRDGRARFHPIYDPARVTQIIIASGVVAVLLLQAVRWLSSKREKQR